MLTDVQRTPQAFAAPNRLPLAAHRQTSALCGIGLRGVRASAAAPSRSLTLTRLDAAAEARPSLDSTVPRRHQVRSAERNSSVKWLRNLSSIPRSRTLRRIRSHLLANTAWAALVYLGMLLFPATLKMVPPLLRALRPC